MRVSSAARSGWVDQALHQTEKDIRVDPRSLRLPLSTISLRQSMETLEHEAIAVRVLARSRKPALGHPRPPGMCTGPTGGCCRRLDLMGPIDT